MDHVLDLTQPLGVDAHSPPGLPEARFERVRTLASHGLNSSVIQVSVHTGTHLDAPVHTRDGVAGISDIPLDRLSASAVVWPIASDGAREIRKEDLEAALPAVTDGEFVLLSTGWASRYGVNDDYRLHPWLAESAADWLVERGVRLLGVDTPSPDKPKPFREPDFNYPVHHILLDRGVLIVENLGILSPIAGQRVRVRVFPVPLVGCDAAPARIIAEY
jgi:kynurenine formamidase